LKESISINTLSARNIPSYYFAGAEVRTDKITQAHSSFSHVHVDEVIGNKSGVCRDRGLAVKPREICLVTALEFLIDLILPAAPRPWIRLIV
jgi:hypothetical protein